MTVVLSTYFMVYSKAIGKIDGGRGSSETITVCQEGHIIAMWCPASGCLGASRLSVTEISYQAKHDGVLADK